VGLYLRVEKQFSGIAGPGGAHTTRPTEEAMAGRFPSARTRHDDGHRCTGGVRRRPS
jgi:hypothetical protein